jgi:hypothetical protein
VAKSFLELVNDAIDESKVQLDPLDSSTFANPPRTVMYNRFKKWVNMAYRELLLARNEWYFRKERATLSVWPRLQMAGLTTIPAVGDTFTGDSSGVVFTVKAIHNIEDVEGDSVTERCLSVEFSDESDPNNLIVLETFTGSDGVDGYSAGYYKGLGRYDFKADITNLQEIDPQTIRIYDTPDDAVSDPVIPKEGSQLAYTAWDKWLNDYTLYPWIGDYPIKIAETSLGTYAMYPMPARESVLTFDFTKKVTDMVYYDDIPESIPEEYHEYLSWRAVEEYADFDSNPKLFSRAQKHTRNYWNWLDRDQKQEVRFEDSRF